MSFELNRATSRLRHPGHTSAALAVRAALREASEPLLIEDIARIAGLPCEKVRNAINKMLTVGGIWSVREGKTARYCLWARRPGVV